MLKMDVKVIKQRITELCKQKKWSYYRLAKEAGFQQSTLKPILKERNLPNLYTLQKICTALDISLSDFFRSDLFNYDTRSDNSYNELWNQLSSNEKEKVLIYMYGLLHLDIPKEGFENDL